VLFRIREDRAAILCLFSSTKLGLGAAAGLRVLQTLDIDFALFFLVFLAAFSRFAWVS